MSHPHWNQKGVCERIVMDTLHVKADGGGMAVASGAG